MLVFQDMGKPEYPREKPLGAKERTNNKLNPHMASTPGFEPGPRWGEASALTTAPSHAPRARDDKNTSNRQLSLFLGHYCQNLAIIEQTCLWLSLFKII